MVAGQLQLFHVFLLKYAQLFGVGSRHPGQLAFRGFGYLFQAHGVEILLHFLQGVAKIGGVILNALVIFLVDGFKCLCPGLFQFGGVLMEFVCLIDSGLVFRGRLGFGFLPVCLQQFGQLAIMPAHLPQLLFQRLGRR